jgi:hypothetical protein
VGRDYNGGTNETADHVPFQVTGERRMEEKEKEKVRFDQQGFMTPSGEPLAWAH